jgi:hypothetical protein
MFTRDFATAELQGKFRCRKFSLNLFWIVSGQVEVIYSDGLHNSKEIKQIIFRRRNISL